MIGWLLPGCSTNENQTTEVKAKIASPIWKNRWQRQSRFSGGELDVKSIHEDTITFTLSASDGGHSGELEGDVSSVGEDGEDGDGQAEIEALRGSLLRGRRVLHWGKDITRGWMEPTRRSERQPRKR